MKKKFLSLLTALCLMLCMAPAALAADESGLQDLINNAAAGSTIELTSDYNLSEPVIINKAITINGNGHSVTGASGQNAFNATVGNVTLNNLTINASGIGYGINSTGSSLTVNNCNINVTERGINFYPTNGSNATLDVSGTVIKNTAVSDYDTSVNYSGNNRGIATADVIGGTITIEDSDILGFKYSINAVVTPDEVTGLRDGNGTLFSVSNTFIKGWTALNIWSANTDFIFTNCSLVGINTLSGASNGFSTIKANDGIYGGQTNKASYVQFIGGAVTAVKYGSASQTVFNVDQECQTEFAFTKNGDVNVWVKYFGPENVAGSTTRYIYMWNFSPDADTAAVNSYLTDKVSGEDTDENVSLSGGTLEEYAAEIAAASILDAPSAEATISMGHIGGGN